MTLRWGDYPGLLEGALGNRKDPYTRKSTSSRVREKSDVMLLTLKTEEGTTGRGMRQPVEARKSREANSPLEPLRGMQPVDPLL